MLDSVTVFGIGQLPASNAERLRCRHPGRRQSGRTTCSFWTQKKSQKLSVSNKGQKCFDGCFAIRQKSPWQGGRAAVRWGGGSTWLHTKS